jgi:hypothetical protein
MDFEEKKHSNYDLDNTYIHAYIHAYQGVLSNPYSTYSPIPQQLSTTSRPLKMSPLASCSVLPCSRVMLAANSSVWSRISYCSWRNTL